MTVHSVRFELLDEFWLEALLTGDEVGGKPREKLDGLLMTTVKHMIAPANVIDLLSILPFWIEKLAPSAGADKGGVLVILRILRLSPRMLLRPAPVFTEPLVVVAMGVVFPLTRTQLRDFFFSFLEMVIFHGQDAEMLGQTL